MVAHNGRERIVLSLSIAGDAGGFSRSECPQCDRDFKQKVEETSFESAFTATAAAGDLPGRTAVVAPRNAGGRIVART